MSLAAVEQRLQTRLGLDPVLAGPGLVARAVRGRLAALGMAADDTAGYVRLLDRSDDEFQALVDDVVVPESWFFRDEVPFAWLAERARDALGASPARPPFRVLSAPCATGEEPYSAAIALVEAGLNPSRFVVDAVDVSRRALAAAARGVYSTNAFRSRDLGFRDRHFSTSPGGFALSPEVTRLVRFRPGNLVDPTLLAGETPYDAVFCRNVLIYLDEPSRERALANVDRLLAPGGVLFLGHADRLGRRTERLQPAGPKGSFAYERGPGAAPVAPLRSLPAPRPSPRPRALPPARPAAPSRPPSVPRTAPVVPEARPDTRLDDAARLADAGRYGEALGLAEAYVAARGPSARAYYVMGAARQALGDARGAESCFEKVVYLDPRHEDALLALALLAQRRGDAAAAANYGRRAEAAFRERAQS